MARVQVASLWNTQLDIFEEEALQPPE